jgi:hypothetical protein
MSADKVIAITHRAAWLSAWSSAARTAEAVGQHPTTAATSGVALSIVAVLQSAQDVVSTVIALLTSLTALVVAGMGLHRATKKWLKPKAKP